MRTIKLKPTTPPVIKAETHDDEWRYSVEFDALPWFEQASDTEIVELAGCGWGGDYEADGVAEFCEDTDANVRRMFDNKDDVGFECHVDEGSAMAWLKDNRPNVFAQLKD